METQMTDYRTVREAAEAWGVTVRYANMCIADGRIPGAVKMGNMWLLPKDAEKPVGKREKKEPRQKTFSSDLAYVIASASIPAPMNDPDAVIDMIKDERLRVIPEMALAYARGDFERVKRRFHDIEGDDAVKLCACSLAIPTAINMGSYPFYLAVETYLKGVVEANTSALVTAYAELVLASGYLGAGAPNTVPNWLKFGDFSALPPEAKRNAAYMRVQYFRWQGDSELMLAVAQTSLALCASEQGLTLEDTSLRLLCAAACCALGRYDDAKHYIMDALKKNLPHGFITPFADMIPFFGGLLERILIKEFPAHYNTVIGQWKRSTTNWLVFHNYFTKDNITLILTLREYEIALLAVRRIPYAKIAEQLNISIGRLNNIMREIYDKLYITNRRELSKMIL